MKSWISRNLRRPGTVSADPSLPQYDQEVERAVVEVAGFIREFRRCSRSAERVVILHRFLEYQTKFNSETWSRIQPLLDERDKEIGVNSFLEVLCKDFRKKLKGVMERRSTNDVIFFMSETSYSTSWPYTVRVFDIIRRMVTKETRARIISAQKLTSMAIWLLQKLFSSEERNSIHLDVIDLDEPSISSSAVAKSAVFRRESSSKSTQSADNSVAEFDHNVYGQLLEFIRHMCCFVSPLKEIIKSDALKLIVYLVPLGINNVKSTPPLALDASISILESLCANDSFVSEEGVLYLHSHLWIRRMLLSISYSMNMLDIEPGMKKIELMKNLIFSACKKNVYYLLQDFLEQNGHLQLVSIAIEFSHKLSTCKEVSVVHIHNIVDSLFQFSFFGEKRLDLLQNSSSFFSIDTSFVTSEITRRLRPQKREDSELILRSLESLQALLELFQRFESPDLKSYVLNFILEIYVSHPSNFLVAQKNQPLAILINALANNSVEVRSHIFKVLEFVILVKKYVPTGELELLSSLLSNSIPCLFNQDLNDNEVVHNMEKQKVLFHLSLNFINKLCDVDSNLYQNVFREANILNSVVRYIELLAESLQTSTQFLMIERETFSYVAYTLRNLLSGNDSNVEVFRSLNCHRYLHSLLIYDFFRPSALCLLRDQNDEENLSNLNILLQNSFSTVSIRIDILQTFTIMLLQGIQVKSRWREIGGFEAILLLLKQFKNQLNCTMEEKWTLFDSIVSCITAALSNYPFNRSYLWNTLRWQEILGLLRESGIYDSPKARLAWKRFMDIAFERVPDIPYFRFENHIHSIFGHLGATGSSENRLKRVIQINEHEISSEDIISSASVYQSMLSKSANAVSLPSNSCLSDSSLSNSCIQNPEVLLILISLIRKLSIPDIIQELKSLLELFVGKDTENHLLRNMEVLSKSGFLQLVLETFDDILNVESSKKGAVHSSLMFDLKDILLEIAHSICAYRPSSLELKGVLNVGSKSSYRWIMHMLAAYPQSSSFWECELMSRGNAGISVPTIPNIFNSSNGFSVSIWIRIVKCSTNPMPVPLFEIYRKRKADKIRLVACIQPSGIIRISNAHSEFVDFSTLKPILQGEWYHFVISKSSGRNSKLLTLTINGSQSESKTFNFGLPISSKPFRDSSASMIIGQDGDTSERNRVGLIWWIGALMVTSESLEAEQIKSLYEKSHDYPGTLPPERFQFSLSESSSILDPLEDHKRKTVSIDPKSVIFAFHPSRVFGLELFSLEKTGIFLSDKLSELNSLWIEVSQKDPGLIVTNSSWLDGNHTTPIGILTGGITRIDIKNIADSLRMLGGPALFFPSIANAHSAQLLEHSLTLFGSLISSNKKNRDEITRIFGYEILAHCLISSPFCEKLSSSVLDVLFAIAEGQDLLDFKFENIHTQDQTMSWVKKARSATILPKGRLHEAIYCRTNQMNLQNNHSYKGIILNPEFVKHVLVSVRFWKKCNFSMLEQVFNKIFDWIRVSPSVVEILGIESASTVGCRPFRGYNGYQIIQIGIIAEILQFLIAADIPPNLVPIIGHLFRVLIDEGIPFRDLESISSFLVLGVGIDSPQGINVPNSSLKVPADSMIDESHVVGTNIRSGYLRLHIDNSEINSALSQVISDRYSPQIAIARQLFDALADFVLRETQTEYTPATPNSASHKMDKELHLNDALSIFSPYWFFLFIWGEVHPIVTVSAMKLLLVLRLRVSSFESTFKGIPGDGALASELEFISPSKELICIVWQMILRNLLDDDLETLHSSMIKFQNISVQSLELLRSVLFLSCRYLAESTEQSARSTIKCSLDIFLTILRVSTDDLSPIVQIETVCALLPLAKFDELKCTVRNILSEIFYQALFSSMQVEPVLLLQLLGMHLLASFKELDSTVDYLASILQSLAEICGDESRRRSMIFNENTWTKIKYVSRALYEAIETTKESIFFHSFILSATKFFFEILHLLSTLLDVSHEHFTFVEVVDCYGFCCGSLHRILIWYFHEFASCVDELSKLLDLMLQHGSLIFHAPRTEEENFIPLFCFHSIRILVLAPKSSLLESLIGSCWNLMLTKKKNILLEKCFPISFRFHPKTLEKVSADAREALCDGSKNSPQDFISSHCDQLLAVLAQTCDGYWSLFIAQRKNLKRLESDSFQNTRPSPIVASNFQTRLDNLRHDLAPKIQIIEQIRQTKRRQREFYEEQRSSRLWRRLDRNLSLESPVSFVKRSLPPDRWKLDTVEDYLGQRKKLARCEEFYDVFNISPDEILKHQNKNLDVSRRPPPALKSTGDFSLTSGRPLAFSVHSSKPFGMFTEDNIVEYSDEIEGAQDSSHGILAAEVDEDSDDDQLDDEDHLGSSSPLSEADTKVREDEMILRLLAPGDRILTKNAFFNCKRVTGLDPCDAILVMCISSVYVVDNFHLSDSGDIEEIKDYKASWRFLTELVPSGSDLLLRVCSRAENSSVPLIDDDIHSARQILYGQIRQVFRRRFSLQNVALEIYLFDGSSHLLVFSSRDERELFIGRLRRLNVCESAFNEQIQQKGMMQRWQSGELSNFAYLMYLNRHAGRTYNDLTQYPVFPWILSDYRSSRLNLSDPSIYRDLSKPMGALGASRSSKFRAQYEQWSDPSTPAWHYGSHYSSSAIVIGYLLRLEPFARIACELQSGQFDKADRLFKDVELAWRQASELGSQDVRELIPEFFCLSAFLENQNNFDLGETQRGHRVDHIKLPAWSYGDSERFIRLHRAALESEYVSANLHAWIDLIFGFKQMGPASIAAQNVFHFATYEQNVDVESIPDPVEKQAMICMIQNFGQTPRQLFKKAHPRRRLGRAPPCVTLDARSIEYRIIRQIDGPVSGIYHTREDRPPLAISGQSLLIGPKYRKLIRWGFPDCGIRFFQFLSTPRHPVNQLRGSYEGLHDSPLTRLAVTEDGRYLVSGSEDGVISLWCLSTRSSHSSLSLWRRWTAHVAPIEGLAASSAHSLVVSSSSDGVVVLWDLARGQLLRRLDKFDSLVSCVSIVEKTGDVIVASGAEISIWTMNGKCIIRERLVSIEEEQSEDLSITAVGMTSEPDWISVWNAVITGFADGSVAIWQIVDNPFPEDRHMHIKNGKIIRQSELSRNIQLETQDKFPRPSLGLRLESWVRAHNSPVTSIGTSTHVLRRMWSGDSDGSVIQWEVSALGDTLSGPKLVRNYCAVCRQEFLEARKLRRICPACNLFVCEGCGETVLEQEKRRWNCRACIVNSKQKDNKG